jgi:hypothetical protein
MQVLPTSGGTGAYTVVSYISSSSANSTNVVSVPHSFYGYSIFNSTATIQSLHLYHTTSAPTVGTTAGLFMTIPVTGSTGGGGANLVSLFPLSYSTIGLAFTVSNSPVSTSTGISLSAADLVINLYYI